jgi:hypothetical protein
VKTNVGPFCAAAGVDTAINSISAHSFIDRMRADGRRRA